MSVKRNKPFQTKGGIVYLVASPIGNIKDISTRFMEIVSEADIVACEDTRNTGLLLSRLNITPKKLVSCYSQIESNEAIKLVEEVKNKNLTLVYLSDAGTPGISDPGALLIKEAIDKDVAVSAIPGPSALIQALITSGFDTSDFSFYGFLPVKNNSQKEVLEKLKEREETLIFYEAPHRLFDTLKNMKEVFSGERRVCLSREITKLYEEHIRGTLDEITSLDPSTVKGEFVIVVEGNSNPSVEITDDKIIKEAQVLLKSGMRKNDVSKYLADKLKISKNRIYMLIKNI